MIPNSPISTSWAGAPISTLNLGYTAVADLKPLHGMPIKRLWLYHTQVTDLSPLQGMPLETLNLVNTKIADLSALRGMPLTELKLNSCDAIIDVSPLAESKTLKNLILPANAKNTEALRGLTQLTHLGYHEEPGTRNADKLADKTAAAFWAEFDAKGKVENKQP